MYYLMNIYHQKDNVLHYSTYSTVFIIYLSYKLQSRGRQAGLQNGFQGHIKWQSGAQM
jgi:hypothetical protein